MKFRDLPETEQKKWCEQALRRPSDFGYWGDDARMFKTVSLGPVIHTSASDKSQRKQGRSVLALLRKHFPQKTKKRKAYQEQLWYTSTYLHWAVGEVTHLSFLVYDQDGKPSKVAEIIHDFYE